MYRSDCAGTLVDGFASDDDTHAFKITSKYGSKSKKIRTNYFEIQDWQAAGLRKPSWIDTNVALDFNDLPQYQVIGKLSGDDLARFIDFLHTR